MHVGILERVDGQPLELLVGAFTASPVPKVVVSLAEGEVGRFVAVNRAFSDLVGYGHHELVGQSSLLVVAAEDRAVVDGLFDGMVRGEIREAVIERVLVRRDGSRVWISSRNFLGHDHAGRSFLIAEVVDSGSRRAPADSEAWFRSLVEASPIGTAVLDGDGHWVPASPDLLALTTLDGTVLRVNAAWQRLLGWSEDDLVGTRLSALRHPDEVAAADGPGAGTFRYRARDGGYRWVHWSGTVVADQQVVMATGRDVTDAVTAERSAAREADRLRATIRVQREISAVAADRDEVLRLIADRTLEVISTGEAASVHLTDPDGQAMRMVAATGGLADGDPQLLTLLADAAMTAITGQVEDVTARRAAESELRRQARLLELIPAAVIVRDLDGVIRWWNAGATALYGWPLSAATGKPVDRLLVTAFDGHDTAAGQREHLEREGSWEGQLQHVTAGGRTLTVLSRQVLHQPEPGSDGRREPPQVLEINTDVTAARDAEVALAESEQRLRAQFDNSAAGQVIRALDGTLIAVNPAFAGMLGYTVGELTGTAETDLLDPADHRDYQRLTAGLFAGEADSYTREGLLRHAGGHRVDTEATISLVRDDSGRPKHLIGVFTDISGRRTAERARDNAAAVLAERNTELEAANQLKLDIIGMLGHEIGNPLTTIQGHAEILADDWAGLDDRRRTRAIDAIGRQATRLDTIVREVLAMVTIDAGSIRADRHELSVREEVARALDDELVPVYGEDVRVLFSPGHLQQILVNLLSNAAKYGGGATAVHIGRSERLVHVTVEDGGPGVPEQFRDRLFDRLTRAERDATSVRGTGLGLYIVRGLARANHGEVHHEPNPAGGSRFIVDLEPASLCEGGARGSS
ncbi:hypothetical protein Ait01nite_096060 [Actinoplanes italicus]|uniref:histidine kinase n=1 Tax=Actinoplanes italicus TaxID=113567 RepID=A0A2T0JM22_9ACTN|nr:PAS domain S-box protein [Actinoplanes italicus]PRX08656.1 PAS domain S-box-containing protein [Actinoplanes italicus]GIE36561.1 hypothetical protein Ait01nite_096060 [Actinoplanes italicus]